MVGKASRARTYTAFGIAALCWALSASNLGYISFFYAFALAASLVAQWLWFKDVPLLTASRALEFYVLLCASALMYLLPSALSGRLLSDGFQVQQTAIWAAVTVAVHAGGALLALRLDWRRGAGVALALFFAMVAACGVRWVQSGEERPPMLAVLLPVIGYLPGVAGAIDNVPIQVNLSASE